MSITYRDATAKPAEPTRAEHAAEVEHSQWLNHPITRRKLAFLVERLQQSRQLAENQAVNAETDLKVRTANITAFILDREINLIKATHESV